MSVILEAYKKWQEDIIESLEISKEDLRKMKLEKHPTIDKLMIVTIPMKKLFKPQQEK